MVLLKHLKKHIKNQLNQLVMPEIEALSPSALELYSNSNQKNEHPSQNVAHYSETSSFQDTFKGVYSHGLEEIYTLQDVDVTKIKTFGVQTESQELESQDFNDRYILPKSPQLELSLADEFRSTIDSFILSEPIRVLNLSTHAEKYLKQHGKKVLKDLIDEDWAAFSISKGAGQGHIDEIISKLKEYIGGRTLKDCNTVDFEALIRSLISDDYRTKQYVLLDKYQLGYLITLFPSESVEVRRLSMEQRDSSIQESIKLFRSESGQKFCNLSLQKITDVFIKPWLRGRSGFCRRFELMDRLEQVSNNASAMHHVVKFLADVNSEGHFPFNKLLHVIDHDIFCVDEVSQSSFLRIENTAMTYFYKTNLTYRLEEIISWLSREYASCWKGFPDGYLEKVLRTSKRFYVTKNEKGHLLVHLA